ncbi:hypothetical protein [Actinomadura macra]|nr:hypothetical protein [Actinomadura macra]
MQRRPEAAVLGSSDRDRFGTWPADKAITVPFGDGKDTQTWDRAITRYED